MSRRRHPGAVPATVRIAAAAAVAIAGVALLAAGSAGRTGAPAAAPPGGGSAFRSTAGATARPDTRSAAAAPGRRHRRRAPGPEALVEAYNRRPFGGPGWRRIRLELLEGDRVTRRFEVVHGWQDDGERVSSLVLLEQPEGLRGTSYLLAEGPHLPTGMEVFLELPSGDRRVLAIKPGRFDEGLLGSDFGYSDLLWRLPVAGRRLRLAGETAIDGTPAWVVDSVPVTEAARSGTTWGKTRWILGKDPVLLLAAAYFPEPPGGGTGSADGDPPAAKRLRVEGWRRLDGAWTPGRMEMSVSGGRRSILTLVEAHFGLPRFPEEAFRPQALPALAETLRAGRLPSFIQHSR